MPNAAWPSDSTCNNVRVGRFCIQDCAPGYEASADSGPPRVVCDYDGTWRFLLGSCVPVGEVPCAAAAGMGSRYIHRYRCSEATPSTGVINARLPCVSGKPVGSPKHDTRHDAVLRLTVMRCVALLSWASPSAAAAN